MNARHYLSHNNYMSRILQQKKKKKETNHARMGLNRQTKISYKSTLNNSLNARAMPMSFSCLNLCLLFFHFFHSLFLLTTNELQKQKKFILNGSIVVPSYYCTPATINSTNVIINNGKGVDCIPPFFTLY